MNNFRMYAFQPLNLKPIYGSYWSYYPAIEDPKIKILINIGPHILRRLQKVCENLAPIK
jgi:hypothetical protein